MKKSLLRFTPLLILLSLLPFASAIWNPLHKPGLYKLPLSPGTCYINDDEGCTKRCQGIYIYRREAVMGHCAFRLNFKLLCECWRTS
uniref:Defensin-like cystein-rich peptide n=1 Tax=Torenia fournieri TaxID=68875 RepID=B9ZZZ2_9LAMI|nr:defensin-like cystein-rich peptide [Torenia fournieri]